MSTSNGVPQQQRCHSWSATGTTNDYAGKLQDLSLPFDPGPREVPPGSENVLRLFQRQLSDPLHVRGLAGQHAMPVAAPDLVGDRPEVHPEWSCNEVHAMNAETSPLWQEHPWLYSLLIVCFLCCDSSQYVLAVQSLRSTHDGGCKAQAFVLLQSCMGFVGGLATTAVMEGSAGFREIVRPLEALRWLPMSIGFSLSQFTLWHAFSVGLGPGTAVAVGFLYIPLCAVISRWLFCRVYGWLETHALVLLTLSALTFAELRSRILALNESHFGFIYALISLVLDAIAGLLSERALKLKYSGAADAPYTHFWVQKVRIELWGMLTSAGILLWLSRGQPVDSFRDWSVICWAAILTRVAQGWMAGLVAKHLSTVAKAVIQCLSGLLVFFFGDLLVLGRGCTSLPMSLLSVVVALSALMYQMGRRRTVQQQLRGSSAVDTGGACTADPELRVDAARLIQQRRAASYSARSFVSENQALAPNEFETPVQGCRHVRRWPECPRIRCLSLIDRRWLEHTQACNGNFAAWASSWSGLFSQLACIVAFMVADAGRTIVYEWALKDTAIVQQSLVVMMSAASVVIGCLLAGALDGAAGLRAALDPWEALRYFPVAMVFSMGTTCTVFAYGVGVSGVQVTVIGYAYIPLSAFLSRWIFKRAYRQLEWLALTLMVLCVSSFVLMTQTTHSTDKLTLLGVCFVLLATVLSCLGSMLAEKIMKAGQHPFYIQNVSMQIGSAITALGLLFLQGAISSRPNDAFWKPRDIGGGVMAKGVFVGWGLKSWIALASSTVQSWLAGLIAKRLSTVTRSVVQCLELVLIYAVGDLWIKHEKFDWPLGAMSLAVAFTVQLFTQAGRNPEPIYEPAAAPESAVGGRQADAGR